MAVTTAQWTIDVHDVDVMARFWAAALGYEIDRGGDGNAKLYPPADAPPGRPTVWLQASGTPKRGKNRLHLDLVPDAGAEAEAERLVGLGARYADVGQTGEEEFLVLADPEDNEFCVLRRDPRRNP
jgi:hypothetical protein